MPPKYKVDPATSEIVIASGQHTCHATGCTKPVKPSLLMCARHWRMVPRLLQADVWRHYRAGQEVDKRPTREYLAAAAAAVEAVFRAEREALR